MEASQNEALLSIRVPTAQGKMGNEAKRFSVRVGNIAKIHGKHRNLVCSRSRILQCLLQNLRILFLETECVCQVSFAYRKQPEITGKICGWSGGETGKTQGI